MEIKIYGPGCAKCVAVEKLVRGGGGSKIAVHFGGKNFRHPRDDEGRHPFDAGRRDRRSAQIFRSRAAQGRSRVLDPLKAFVMVLRWAPTFFVRVEDPDTRV